MFVTNHTILWNIRGKTSQIQLLHGIQQLQLQPHSSRIIIVIPIHQNGSLRRRLTVVKPTLLL
jgi:5,10-methylene-tetrahydrofolate dehydrogenase/methenyl tetrahydrofolate cyclohydrolase